MNNLHPRLRIPRLQTQIISPESGKLLRRGQKRKKEENQKKNKIERKTRTLPKLPRSIQSILTLQVRVKTREYSQVIYNNYSKKGDFA